jgi:hypothetical protein
MKSVFGLALLALATSGAYAQNIEIVSPKHAYTFAYGDAISHQIERDRLTNEMIARVTFSNYPYAGDREARRDEMFDFVFPGLHFDATQNEFFARTSRRGCADSNRGITSELSLCRLQARADHKNFSRETQRSRHGGAECDGAATRWSTLDANRRQLVVAEFARSRLRANDALEAIGR